MSTKLNSLAHEERLRGRSRVSQLFNEGHSGFVYPLRYVWIDDEGNAEGESKLASVLFNVPKRFHRRANKRHLLRRRVKEAYRLEKSALVVEGRPRLNVALIYSTKEELPYSNILRSVKKILNQINDERSALTSSHE
ncbi:MAG: ribonuclease P protein component [Rikenellaceae bacterium]